MTVLPYDPRPINRLLNIALAVLLMMVFVYLWSNYQSSTYIDLAMAGTQTDAEFADATAYEDRQTMVTGVAYFGVALIEVILLMVWVYRTSANAAAIRPDAARITPGWAVGWFFVPFANLWMPFKALNQVWHSSDAQGENLDAPFANLLQNYMAALIATLFASRLAGQMMLQAEDIESFRTALTVGNLSTIPDVWLVVSTYLLAKQITHSQVTYRSDASAESVENL